MEGKAAPGIYELGGPDVETFRATGIKDVAWSATFSEDEAVVDAARWIVWEASQELGVRSASIHELYMARSRDEYSGWSEPAINLRTQVFDMAAAGCRAAMEIGAGSPIWELARSEQAYTFQRPGEYITSVLAGAASGGPLLAGPGGGAKNGQMIPGDGPRHRGGARRL